MEMLRARGNTNNVVHVPNLSANNLLQKFFITSSSKKDSVFDYGENREEAKKKKEEEEEEEDVELTLGLSLNGQFGTDPRSRKRKNLELVRSSSIPEGFIFEQQRSGGDMEFTVGGRGGGGVSDVFHLDRTRSLPVETEIETEKKKKKTRTFLDFTVKNRTQGGDETEKKSRAFLEFQLPLPTKAKEDKVMSCPVNGGRGKMVNKTTEKEKKKKNVVDGMEKARNILEDMPCVSTRDVGANGKRVEGFLYWYGGNKEEVKIVCVCHGSFLSPAEFVRHGGGGGDNNNDGGGVGVMTNPLRHIVVKLPSSSSSSPSL